MLLKQSKACMFKHVLEDHTRLYESEIRQTILQQLTLIGSSSSFHVCSSTFAAILAIQGPTLIYM